MLSEGTPSNEKRGKKKEGQANREKTEHCCLSRKGGGRSSAKERLQKISTVSHLRRAPLQKKKLEHGKTFRQHEKSCG